MTFAFLIYLSLVAFLLACAVEPAPQEMSMRSAAILISAYVASMSLLAWMLAE